MDTRFEVTVTKLKFALFDTNMELNSYDMEMVALLSFDKDIHNKIGTKECNTIGRSEGDVIKEEKMSSTVLKDREIIKTSWSSKDKVGSGEYLLCQPPKKPGGEEADEVDKYNNNNITSISHNPQVHYLHKHPLIV